MTLRRIVDDLTGRSHHQLTDLLAAQLDAAIEGVGLASAMSDGTLTPAQARGAMVDVEHRGDTGRAGLVAGLGVALTTPIDREDLYRFSRSVDDVLDNIRDLVRETDLYGGEGEPADLPALAGVAEGLAMLRGAVRGLADRPGEVDAATSAARKSAGQVRRHYQLAMAQLLRQEVSTDTLTRRELLRRLDAVGLRLGESVAALSDAMLKRSH
ncbi:DUF47 domain-containing protein [Streptomyces sp. NPDC048680]|uniref:DUF47 domain-containing protein n=1 Tax=Streptomyces sp. NPDC048680 TaxID=3155492 RepID=UPI003417A9BA